MKPAGWILMGLVAGVFARALSFAPKMVSVLCLFVAIAFFSGAILREQWRTWQYRLKARARDVSIPTADDWEDCPESIEFGAIKIHCNCRKGHEGLHEGTTIGWS